jgi:hypothetical protein
MYEIFRLKVLTSYTASFTFFVRPEKETSSHTSEQFKLNHPFYAIDEIIPYEVYRNRICPNILIKGQSRENQRSTFSIFSVSLADVTKNIIHFLLLGLPIFLFPSSILNNILIAAIRATFRVHLTTVIAVTDHRKSTETRCVVVTKEM